MIDLIGVLRNILSKVSDIEGYSYKNYWYGKSAGDTFLDPAVLTEWQVTAGTGEAYGTEVQISNGDEVESGDSTKHFRINKILVTAVSTANKIYKIQFLYGTGVVGAAAVATEVAGFFMAAGKANAIVFTTPKIACNNKLWVKLACETNAATLDFIVGLVLE